MGVSRWRPIFLKAKCPFLFSKSSPCSMSILKKVHQIYLRGKRLSHYSCRRLCFAFHLGFVGSVVRKLHSKYVYIFCAFLHTACKDTTASNKPFLNILGGMTAVTVQNNVDATLPFYSLCCLETSKKKLHHAIIFSYWDEIPRYTRRIIRLFVSPIFHSPSDYRPR